MPLRNHALFPFANIIETQKYPHARTLRTSFFQKLVDCYNVISGVFHPGNTYVGIFDYLTLFIPLAWNYLLNTVKKSRYKNNYFILAPMWTIHVLLSIPRVSLGVAAMILASPIVAVVHGIARLMTREKTKLKTRHASALAVPGAIYDQSHTKHDGITLHDYMVGDEINNIEDLNVHLEKFNGTCRLHFFKAQDKRQDLEHVKNNSLSIEVPTTKEGIEMLAPYYRRNLHTLFSLNLANVVNMIENDNELSQTSILTI